MREIESQIDWCPEIDHRKDIQGKKRVEKILMEFSTKGLTTPITEKKYKKTKTEKA